jgi:hypothetical protein
MNLRIAVGLALVFFVAGCAPVQRQGPQEPVYQDRRLSEWLRDFDDTAHPERQAGAAEAVRHIGPPAVPFLIEQLSEAKTKQFRAEQEAWHERQSASDTDIPRPPNPRHEAMAALDALGSQAATALPALQRLLQENPPDMQALYVAARIGPASYPLLNQSLTNNFRGLKLGAEVCFEMMRTHDKLLYPTIPVGPDAPSYDRRICEFNLKILNAAVKAYRADQLDSSGKRVGDPHQ